MRSSRRKLLTLSLIAASLLTTGIFAWKAMRQEQLNVALISAIKHNETEAALSLLASGADPNARNVPTGAHYMRQRLWDRLRGKRLQGETVPSALLLAVREESGNESDLENRPLVKALLDKGAEVNARDEGARTALIWAVLHDHPATVRLLLDRGADVNVKDNDFDTTFHVAGPSGMPTHIWHLHHHGMTVLQHADDLDALGMMQLLLEHGADINARIDYGSTLLIKDTMRGEDDKFRLLLAHGANVNATDTDGRTALMLLASHAHTAEVLLLLQQGADVNARDQAGRTALMYNTDGADADPATLQLLLQWGADPQIKSKTGETALSIALDGGRTKSIALLKAGIKAMERKRKP